MPALSSSLRAPKLSFWLALAAASVLYFSILDNAAYQRSGGGEARIAGAFEVVVLTATLWITLSILLVAGATYGRMPRWAVLLAVPFVPISGVAYLAAIDMFCRDTHGAMAALIIVLLPVLIACYALWARLPELHATPKTHLTSALIWTSVCTLSVAALVSFHSGL